MIDWQQNVGQDLNAKLQERYKQSIGKGDGGRKKLQVSLLPDIHTTY
jgi:hypothetical protein